MLFLLSPAKTLDYDTPLPRGLSRRTTQPGFVAQAAELIAGLRTLTPPQVAQLMDLSDALAALNVGRYGAWTPEHTPANSRPAAFAFAGDVYDGLEVRTLSSADLAWLQQHVLILSGLYGALRPLDALQPYRLEMGTRHANARGKDLYAFWGDTVAQHLNQRLADDPHPVIVNLASQEYFKVADRTALAARVVDCQFEDWKGGRYKIISFFAKRARGAMARWAVQHRVRSVKALQGFDVDGYAFDAAASAADRLVFRRRQAD
ncbi:MAG: peroxide stress protein YaaA [Burkholderiaceae bacterium]|nr:peroxide stress protein YaaA [Burkholderiaceae bacterium]